MMLHVFLVTQPLANFVLSRLREMVALKMFGPVSSWRQADVLLSMQVWGCHGELTSFVEFVTSVLREVFPFAL